MLTHLKEQTCNFQAKTSEIHQIIVKKIATENQNTYTVSILKSLKETVTNMQ